MAFSERFKLKEEGSKVKWPVVDGKETSWRFNENYDPYGACANCAATTEGGEHGSDGQY
jgi:hypothetical protein